ncbi:MAG TPA: hypothetical protein VGS20_16705 [Candidatus Acidoferrales bacterium]|nr:hypothetical protein [Candidatus Acidoferrales bacterium]
MNDELRSKRRLTALWAGLALAIIVAGLNFTPAHRLARRFFQSLRMGKVQAVNVDLSNFVGPTADRSLQQMVSQMISNKVTVTVNEKTETAPTAAAAGQIAGFPVRLPSAEKDAPRLTVRGNHAFQLTVDRTRLEAIFKEAGRPDVALPQAIDGAVVAVRIPRTVVARYGNCPRPPSATANVATPPPNSTEYSTCAVLSQSPSPVVDVPAGLDLEQLAQIGLELAGMTPDQAHRFLGTVNWQATLGLPVPRFLRSYEAVKVNGVQGTLLNMAGRRGPTYTLVWAKAGMVYSLTGYGSPSDAVTVASSLQ